MLLAVMWAQQPSRVRAMLVGVLVGAALLTKSWPALVVIPVQATLGYRVISRRLVLRDVATTVAVAAAVAAPWMLYAQVAFPAEAAHERAEALRHLTESVEGQATSLRYLLTRIPRVFGELVFVPLAWFLWRAVMGRPSPAWIATAMWVAIPLVTFSLAVSKSISYLAISAPAFFIVQAEFVGRVSDSRWRGAVGEFCRRTVIVLLVLLPLRFAFERLNPLHGRQRTAGWAETLRALRPVLNKSVVLFGTDHPLEAMFITDATAYGSVPSIEQVKALQERGRSIAICQDRPLPTELEAAVDIQKVLCRDGSAADAGELGESGRSR